MSEILALVRTAKERHGSIYEHTAFRFQFGQLIQQVTGVLPVTIPNLLLSSRVRTGLQILFPLKSEVSELAIDARNSAIDNLQCCHLFVNRRFYVLLFFNRDLLTGAGSKGECCLSIFIDTFEYARCE